MLEFCRKKCRKVCRKN
uniref:Uncharacterized protein n=1 Tax=Anguilla anguilla TaxID=7936 RepID=A0A0E9SP22_ANGAN